MPDEVIAVLSESVKGLKRLLDYNGYCLAHLMGQLSDEQFMEVEKGFIMKPDCEIDVESIKRKVKILQAHVGEELTASEIANIFGIDLSLTEIALNGEKE